MYGFIILLLNLYNNLYGSDYIKTAIIGSRTINLKDISAVIPPQTTEIISGGAVGIDYSAKQYAAVHHLRYTEFLPDYKCYGRKAPLVRNIHIIDCCDRLVAVWDGKSKGTVFTVCNAIKRHKPVTLYIHKQNNIPYPAGVFNSDFICIDDPVEITELFSDIDPANTDTEQTMPEISVKPKRKPRTEFIDWKNI